MDFILQNYLIIILVGLFFVFALIGYLIDIVRKNKSEDKEEVYINIKPVEIKDLNIPTEVVKENKEEIESKNDINSADELLKNYDESVNE